MFSRRLFFYGSVVGLFLCLCGLFFSGISLFAFEKTITRVTTSPDPNCETQGGGGGGGDAVCVTNEDSEDGECGLSISGSNSKRLLAVGVMTRIPIGTITRTTVTGHSLGANSYSWSGGSDASGSGNLATFTSEVPKEIPVSFTASATCSVCGSVSSGSVSHGKAEFVGIKSLASSPSASAGERLYVKKGTSITLTATPAGSAFPAGYPLWSGIDAAYLSATKGSVITVKNTLPAGSYTVKATCGISSKAIAISVISMDVPPAIKRNIGEDYDNIYVNIPSKVKVCLKIDRLPGSGSHLSFVTEDNKDGELKITVEGTGSRQAIPVMGNGASTIKNNLTITLHSIIGNAVSANPLITAKTILYEESCNDTVLSLIDQRTVDPERLLYMQRKDTEARCEKCPAAGSHRQEVAHVVDNDWWQGNCIHCKAYCARACLSFLYGGKQDSYVKQGNVPGADNHGVYFTEEDVVRYIQGGNIAFGEPMFFYSVLFNNLASSYYILVLPPPSGQTVSHACVVSKIYTNKPTGELLATTIAYWDPATGTAKEIKFDDVSFVIGHKPNN